MIENKVAVISSCWIFHVRFGKGTENTVLCVTKAPENYMLLECQRSTRNLHICTVNLSRHGGMRRPNFHWSTGFRDSSRANHLCSNHSMNLEHVGGKVGGFPLVTFNF